MVADAADSIERDCASSITETDESDDSYSEFESDDTSSTCPTSPNSIDQENTMPQMALSIHPVLDRRCDEICLFHINVPEFPCQCCASRDEWQDSSNVPANAARAVSSTDATTSTSNAKRGTQGNDPPPPDDESDNDGESDDDRDRGKRRKLNGAARKSGRKLACPYFRHDPQAFSDDKSCSGPGWPSIHRLKYVMARLLMLSELVNGR